MAVTSTNLLMGPGELSRAPFGTAEPATVLTAPAAAWINVGATQDGVTINVSHEFTEIEVDQTIDTPERRLTKREVSVETNMAEATLENLAFALNYAAPTTVSNEKSLEAPNNFAAFVPTYSALLFEGYAPNGKRRRLYVRKALSTEGTETVAKKDEQTLLSVTWMAHFVSTTIAPFKFVDDVTP